MIIYAVAPLLVITNVNVASIAMSNSTLTMSNSQLGSAAENPNTCGLISSVPVRLIGRPVEVPRAGLISTGRSSATAPAVIPTSEPGPQVSPSRKGDAITTNNDITSGIDSLEVNPSIKRYRTIVMDPPWPHYAAGKKHYALMKIANIEALPIPDLLEEDAHVWIWCFVASRFDAQRIAENCWGLTFRSELVWDKRTTGLGNYLRGSHETLLLFTRGKAPIRFKSQRDVVDWPVQRPSAHKPEEALVAIQRLSPGPYLELFSRARFPGFDHWGDQVPGGSDLVIRGYPVPHYSKKALDPRPGSGDEWADGVVRKAA